MTLRSVSRDWRKEEEQNGRTRSRNGRGKGEGGTSLQLRSGFLRLRSGGSRFALVCWCQCLHQGILEGPTVMIR